MECPIVMYSARGLLWVTGVVGALIALLVCEWGRDPPSDTRWASGRGGEATDVGGRGEGPPNLRGQGTRHGDPTFKLVGPREGPYGGEVSTTRGATAGRAGAGAQDRPADSWRHPDLRSGNRIRPGRGVPGVARMRLSSSRPPPATELVPRRDLDADSRPNSPRSFVRVIDDSGAGVAGVRLDVVEPGQRERRTFTTDSNGYASDLQAADGVYTIMLIDAPRTHLRGWIRENGWPDPPSSAQVTLEGDHPDGIVQLRICRASRAVLEIQPHAPLSSARGPERRISGDPRGFGLELGVALEASDGSRRPWSRFIWEVTESEEIRIAGLPPASLILRADLYGIGAGEARATFRTESPQQVLVPLGIGRSVLEVEVPAFDGPDHPMVHVQGLSNGSGPMQFRSLDARRRPGDPDTHTFTLGGLLSGLFVVWTTGTPSGGSWGRVIEDVTAGTTHVSVGRAPKGPPGTVRTWVGFRASDSALSAVERYPAPPPHALFVAPGARNELGAVLDAPGFVDLEPGRFDVLVWCAPGVRGPGASGFIWIRDVLIEAGVRLSLPWP